MKTFIYRYILWSTLLLSSQFLCAQDKFILTAGAGIPEMLNVGARIQLSNLQWGLSIGTAAGPDASRSIATDLLVPIAGTSKFTSRPPTYFKLGIALSRFENDVKIEKYTLLYVRVGREMYLSERFGFFLDGGLLVTAMDDIVYKEPRGFSWLVIEFPTPLVLPSASVGMFVRI